MSGATREWSVLGVLNGDDKLPDDAEQVNVKLAPSAYADVIPFLMGP